jgi:putative ABC transport system permease protein
MGIPLRAGRFPTAREMWEERRVALVNETLVRELFPTRNPIGRRIRTGKDGQWREIIGVVGDVRQKRLDESPKAELYTTFASMPMPFLTVAVRTAGAAEPMENSVRATVHASDAGLAIANLSPLDDYVNAHVADRRFALLLLGLFGVLAVGLGAVGVYGVMSFAVTQRRREMAIRLALGATPVGVRAIVIGDGLRIVVMGAVAGLAAAVVAGRLMRGLLFGVEAFDPLIYLTVPAALLTVAAIAAWLPARRASRIEAMIALRGD